MGADNVVGEGVTDNNDLLPEKWWQTELVGEQK